MVRSISHSHRLRLGLIAVLGASVLPASAKEPESRRPNFLVIVADDLGYSDIGAFGGEIETPHLDAIAARGLKLTGFHTAPTCSPTRSMLVTGLDNHEAGLGNMAELMVDNQRGRPGHEGYLRPDTATIAEILSAGGYRTHYSGKWHLGLTPAQAPHSRGFQTSFALLQGGSNHFGKDLGKGSAFTRSPTYLQDGRPVDRLPDDFYSSDYFATKLVEQLKAGRAGAAGGKPFFAYLSFTAPHWPIQAPPETIAKYKGRYDAGYEVLRERRLDRQKALGLVPANVKAHPFDLAPRWDGLSAGDKALSARRMEVFAAMVDRLDWNVGRVLAALRETGELDNTIVLFLSDNGAEGADLAAASSPISRQNNSNANNGLDNIGKADSYDAIGPGWAEAATAPSWRVKGYETEGGTRTVAFVAGPGIRQGVGTPFTSVMDVTPTILDIAQVERPGRSFAGRTVKPIRGRSWVSWLGGGSRGVYPAEVSVGAELFGGRAVRQGDWKLIDPGDGRWRLYDIARDPGETTDLVAKEPARQASLVKAWDAYAREVGVVLPATPMRILNRPSGR